MKSLDVVHPFTKERKTLPVISIAKTYVTVHWGMSGAYDLNLLKNVMTSRSAKARRKAVCLWIAVDIELVRKAVAMHLAGGDREYETKELMRKHAESMPR